MPLYQLTLFYPTLKDQQESVRIAHSAIQSVCGNNWRVLSAGAQVCAIGFVTTAPLQPLIDQLHRAQGENFHFLLTEIAEVKAGYLLKGANAWLHLADK